MARYLPQIDNNITSLTNSTNLRDPSDILSAQLAQLYLITNGNNSTDNQQQQQQGQDMNLLMNTLLMMPFWSNMCTPTMPMPVLYPNGVTTTTTPQNQNTDRTLDALVTTNGA